MANCLNASCRKEIDDAFAFCPYCGTDNREPHARAPVRCTRHQAAEGGRDCVLCGKRLNEDGTATRGPLHRIAGLVMIVGGLGLIAGAVIEEVYTWRSHFGASFGARRWGSLAMLAGGLYMVGHGWYWVRGQSTDFSLLDEIDPF